MCLAPVLGLLPRTLPRRVFDRHPCWRGDCRDGWVRLPRSGPPPVRGLLADLAQRARADRLRRLRGRCGLRGPGGPNLAAFSKHPLPAAPRVVRLASAGSASGAPERQASGPGPAGGLRVGWGVRACSRRARRACRAPCSHPDSRPGRRSARAGPAAAVPCRRSGDGLADDRSPSASPWPSDDGGATDARRRLAPVRGAGPPAATAGAPFASGRAPWGRPRPQSPPLAARAL